MGLSPATGFARAMRNSVVEHDFGGINRTDVRSSLKLPQVLAVSLVWASDVPDPGILQSMFTMLRPCVDLNDNLNHDHNGHMSGGGGRVGIGEGDSADDGDGGDRAPTDTASRGSGGGGDGGGSGGGGGGGGQGRSPGRGWLGHLLGSSFSPKMSLGASNSSNSNNSVMSGGQGSDVTPIMPLDGPAQYVIENNQLSKLL